MTAPSSFQPVTARYHDFSGMPDEVLQSFCRAWNEVARKAALKASKKRRTSQLSRPNQGDAA